MSLRQFIWRNRIQVSGLLIAALVGFAAAMWGPESHALSVMWGFISGIAFASLLIGVASRRL